LLSRNSEEWISNSTLPGCQVRILGEQCLRSRITGWADCLCACQNTIRSTLIRFYSKGKNLP
jgi:hypothetical protein